MSSCLICCEDFNLYKHCKISCPSCSFSACRSCCQTYILSNSQTICMNRTKNSDGTFICQKPWSRKFVTDNFPKSWVINQWKNMNANLAVEKERALMPATVPIAEQHKKIKHLKNTITQVKHDIKDLYRSTSIQDQTEKHEFRNQIKLLFQRRCHAYSQISKINNDIRDNKNKVITDVKYYGKKCPDENCRGYLSDQWKCGICDMWTCRDCYVIKGSTSDSEHTCDPNTLATAKLLDKDTKPCPKCYTPIHKITGCDQMWCTQCHTAFSWKRGTIETRIHNPHYYEWQRQQNKGTAPRVIGDFECGRDIADRHLHTYIHSLFSSTNFHIFLNANQIDECDSFLQFFMTIIRKTIQLSTHDNIYFQPDNIVDNQTLRIRYLLEEITEKQFTSKVHSAYKKNEKKRDIYNVIQLQVQGVTDIIYRIVDVLRKECDSDNPLEVSIYPHTLTKINNMAKEISALTQYSNSILEEISTTYQCKKWTISYNHNLKHNWKVLI